MFVPSDSWIAVPGHASKTQPEYQSPVCHSQVPLCNSHLQGLEAWYWAQAVALAQTQRNMAGDRWMSDSGALEVSHCLLIPLTQGNPCLLLPPEALRTPYISLYSA